MSAVCEDCNGSGMVAVGQWGARPPRVMCKRCNGTGLIGEPVIVPYGETGTGHAGNETSRARQEEDDSTGRAGYRRRAALQELAYHQSRGMTAGEMEDEMHLGHGAVSSVLSHLHRAGYVSRLTEQRDGMQVYVLPTFVNGRIESPYNPRASYTSRDIERIKREAMARGFREGTVAAAQYVMKNALVTNTLFQGIAYDIVNPYKTEEKDHGPTDGR